MAELDVPELPDLPDGVKQMHPNVYLPAPSWADWMQDVLIDTGGALFNEDHEPLHQATLGVLMTNEDNSKKGRTVLGTAGLGPPTGSDAWSKGKQKQQLERWFGDVPDFLITLQGLWIHMQAQEENAASILALVEHELYHCAQKRDEFGMLAFNKTTGKPIWETRGHDVEEFVGVVCRYGAGAPADKTAQLVEAARREPEVAPAKLNGVCGTCGRPL